MTFVDISLYSLGTYYIIWIDRFSKILLGYLSSLEIVTLDSLQNKKKYLWLVSLPVRPPVQDLEPDPGVEEVDDHQGHAKGHPAGKGQPVGWAEATIENLKIVYFGWLFHKKNIIL